MRSSQLFSTLQKLIKRKPTQKEIADILGVGQSVIGNRVIRDSEFSLEELLKIEAHYGVDLITSVYLNTGVIKSNNVEIDFYPNVFGSCGTGCMVFDETVEKMKVTKDIIHNYSKSNQYSIISARGSSMSPTINDDDKLIIQHNIQNEQIIDDTVYLFKYDNELFIKRLVKNVTQIVCISENPRFDDIKIIPDANNKFEIVGKVVGLIRTKV